MEQQHEIESEMSAVSSNNEMDNPIHDANSLGADAKMKAIADAVSAFGFKESLGGGGGPGKGAQLGPPRRPHPPPKTPWGCFHGAPPPPPARMVV